MCIRDSPRPLHRTSAIWWPYWTLWQPSDTDKHPQITSKQIPPDRSNESWLLQTHTIPIRNGIHRHRHRFLPPAPPPYKKKEKEKEKKNSWCNTNKPKILKRTKEQSTTEPQVLGTVVCLSVTLHLILCNLRPIPSVYLFPILIIAAEKISQGQFLFP